MGSLIGEFAGRRGSTVIGGPVYASTNVKYEQEAYSVSQALLT